MISSTSSPSSSPRSDSPLPPAQLAGSCYVSVRGSVSTPGVSSGSLPGQVISDSSLTECSECLLPPRLASGPAHYVRSTPATMSQCTEFRETFV